jgi:hypothetical protein
MEHFAGDGGALSWREKWVEVMRGERCCLAQVREKHDSQILSAWDAVVSVEVGRDGKMPKECLSVYLGDESGNMTVMWQQWRAEYLVPPGARERGAFAPEIVAAQRLRRVPIDVEELDPRSPHTLDGVDASSIVPGREVELQYRFRDSDPFGWWRGLVDRVQDQSHGRKFSGTVTLEFPHFEPYSIVRYEEVVYSDGMATVNGRCGGFRFPTEAESKPWQILFERDTRGISHLRARHGGVMSWLSRDDQLWLALACVRIIPQPFEDGGGSDSDDYCG